MLTEPCKITEAKRKCNYGLSPTETEETQKNGPWPGKMYTMK